MADEAFLRITITAPTVEQLRECLRSADLDFSCCGAPYQGDDFIRIEAIVRADKIDSLRNRSCQIDVIENATDKGRARQREIGSANRFSPGVETVPRGLGKKE